MARHDHMMKEVSARLFPHVITILNLFKWSISNFGSYSSFLSKKINISILVNHFYPCSQQQKKPPKFRCFIFLVSGFTKISCQCYRWFSWISYRRLYETPVRFPSLQNPRFLGSTKLCGVTMERSWASFMNVVHIHWDAYMQGLHVAILVEHKAQKFFFSEEFSWASHCDEHGARIAWTRSNRPGFDPGHPMEWLTTRCGDPPWVPGGTWPSHIPSHSNQTDVPPCYQPEAVS